MSYFKFLQKWKLRYFFGGKISFFKWGYDIDYWPSRDLASIFEANPWTESRETEFKKAISEKFHSLIFSPRAKHHLLQAFVKMAKVEELLKMLMQVLSLNPTADISKYCNGWNVILYPNMT